MKIIHSKTPLKTIIKQAIVVLSLVIAVPCISQEKDNALSVQYAPGEVLQLIAPITAPEKRHLRDLYFEKNAQTARMHGYHQDGLLIVEETLVGDFSPNVFVVSHWPSLKAQKAFQDLPLFSGVKSLRRKAWEALRLYDHEVPDVVALQFSQNKAYTIAFAWTNPSNPSEYYEYMASLQPLIEKLGGRIMHTINDVVLSAHNPHALAPQQITFVEWETQDGITQLQALPEFTALSQKLQSGTVRFELHRVRPRL